MELELELEFGPAVTCGRSIRVDRYGGAVGLVGFDGHLNTGLTLRTVRVKDGTAEVGEE